MVKTIMLVVGGMLGALLAGMLGFAATQPDTFHVERSISIQAPAEAIFAQIEDLHRWEAWSPFEKLDPTMKKAYSGAERGPGAIYAWEGNSNAGAGRMEVTGTTPPSSVALKLDFTKPFEAHNTLTFTLASKDGATHVTWAMDGPQPFVSKVMCLFVSMDAMIGKDFESGLASLKALAETQATAPQPAKPASAR